MAKYPRKSIYFKAEHVELYNYLETMGKQASEYVCKLIRDDMERDTKKVEEILLEEIKLLRNDLKHVRIEPITEPHSLEEQKTEIEVDDTFGGLLLD
ncbi:MAG: hypothetical protein J6D33_12350 [Turicibacter sp.]|nr:hypothetical protein [Turicibacter sp.]